MNTLVKIETSSLFKSFEFFKNIFFQSALKSLVVGDEGG